MKLKIPIRISLTFLRSLYILDTTRYVEHDRTMNTRRNIGLIISLAGFAITINTFPAFVTWFSERFGIPSGNFGVIFFAQYVAYAIGSVGIGKLHATKKLPLRAIMIITLLAGSIGIFFIGAMINFVSLLLLMMLIGFSGGVMESIGTALLAESSKNGNMIYSSQLFYALGAFSAPLIIGIAINAGVAIPVIGRTVGGFAIAIGLLVFYLVFSPDKNPVYSRSANETIGSTSLHAEPSHKGFAWLFTAMVSYVFMESVIANWLPTFLKEARNTSTGNASLYLTAFWIGLATTRLVYTFFNKKSTKIPLIAQSIMLLVTVVALMLTSERTHPAIMIIIIALIGIGAGPIWPLIVEHGATTYKNESLVMYLVAAGSIGAIVGPSLSSFVFTYTSISIMGLLLVMYEIICLITISIAVNRR